MSRSKKKNMGGRITCCESDKPDKKIWHQQARSNIRRQLKEIEKEPDDFNGFFYNYDDAAYSDTWGWSSDGGTYLHYTKEQLISKFNSEFKSGEMWKDYNCEKIWRRKNNWWFGCLIRNCLKSDLLSEDEFDSYIEENQNHILEIWKKINYGK